MITRFGATVILILIVLSACTFFKDSNIAWEFKTGYPITATPVVAGEHVYIGSDKFYCLDRRTGKVVWQFETSVPMSSSAVLADGCVYFQCGGLYCLDAATGKLLWELWKEDWADTTPAVADGFVYAVINKKVYCFNAKDGKEIWKVELRNNLSSPVVAEGNVYLWGDGELFCLNARSGDILWKMNIEIQPLPIVSQGKVFITDKNKALCIDAKNGNILWGNDFNYSYPARLAVSRDRVFVRANVLYCFNSASGKLEWKKDLGKRLTGIPLVSGSYLYVRSSDSKLNCLNSATGDKLWDIQVPAGRWAIADGNIFVSSTDYKIYCLKTPDR